MPVVQTDRIEKHVLLRATRSRVWHALTETHEFSQWFGVKLTGTFAPGARLRGQVTHKGYEHLTLELTVDRVEPERLFSWRWHPGSEAAAPNEPPTLVVFELEDTPGGTLVTVVETGFDRLPASRYDKAFRENTDGWAEQMPALERYVTAHP